MKLSEKPLEVVKRICQGEESGPIAQNWGNVKAMKTQGDDLERQLCLKCLFRSSYLAATSQRPGGPSGAGDPSAALNSSAPLQAGRQQPAVRSGILLCLLSRPDFEWGQKAFSSSFRLAIKCKNNLPFFLSCVTFLQKAIRFFLNLLRTLEGLGVLKEMK